MQVAKHIAAPQISHWRSPRLNCDTSQMHQYIFDTLLFRILGGSCNNEWILEETGNETDNDGDIIASCMETDDDEKGKDN